MLSQQSQYIATANGQRDTAQLRVYSSWQEVMTLRAEWEQVLRESTGPTIFSTPEWLGAWWKAYGQGKQLMAIAFSSVSGELIGLAPFYLEQLHGGIKRLRLVGDGSVGHTSRDSDNLDLILRTGHAEACARALVGWLAAEPAWDLCELNTLPADSPGLQTLLQLLKAQGWVHATYQRPNSAITLPTNWDSYLEQLSEEHAHGIQRYTRRLHRHYAVRIFKCAHEEELPTYLASLFDLHQRRWNSLGEPGSFSSDKKRHFYAEMSQAFLRRGWLEFWLLELDGTIAAAQFAFRYGDTVYQLQEGLDPAHYPDRAGHILRAHVLQQMIADGVGRYDYLSGPESYKRNWAAQPGAYTDLHFTAKAFGRAHLYMQARDGAGAAKIWLRAHAPALYAVLRNAEHQYNVHRYHLTPGQPAGTPPATVPPSSGESQAPRLISYSAGPVRT